MQTLVETVRRGRKKNIFNGIHQWRLALSFGKLFNWNNYSKIFGIRFGIWNIPNPNKEIQFLAKLNLFLNNVLAKMTCISLLTSFWCRFSVMFVFYFIVDTLYFKDYLVSTCPIVLLSCPQAFHIVLAFFQSTPCDPP